MNTDPAPTVRPVLPQQPEELNQLIQVYDACIPPSERKSAEILRQMCTRADYVVLVAVKAGRIVGFAIGYVAKGAEIGLLEYMGVSPGERSGGIGSLLFIALAERIEAGGRLLLLEVDSETQETSDLEDRRRRKAFYRRLGCRQLAGLRYRMPPVSPQPPPDMEMLVHGDPLPLSVPRTVVGAWLTTLYGEVYDRPSNDRALGEMIARLPDKVSLI